MGKGYRAGRLGEEIRRIVSDMLLRELKDPRLSGKMISVSSVEVTDDGSYATLYLTLMSKNGADADEAEEKKEMLEAFQRAKGLIRKEIGAQMKMRHTPELQFRIDTSMEYGRHIEQIIGQLGIKEEKTKAEEVKHDAE